MAITQILLIEDNPADVELTKEALKCETCKPILHVVTDGEQAMKFLNQEENFKDSPRPDIIFLDLNLPKMGGREVLQSIKSNDNLKSIPVIILTTSDNENDINDAYSMHANCYIRKPVDFKTFRDRIQSTKNFWFSVVKLPDSEEK